MARVSTTTRENVEDDLDRIGALRRESKRLREEAAELAKASVPKAIAEGVPITEIAQRTDMTRQSVYIVTGQRKANP